MHECSTAFTALPPCEGVELCCFNLPAPVIDVDMAAHAGEGQGQADRPSTPPEREGDSARGGDGTTDQEDAGNKEDGQQGALLAERKL